MMTAINMVAAAIAKNYTHLTKYLPSEPRQVVIQFKSIACWWQAILW